MFGITQAVHTSGVPIGLQFTAGAHTGSTASTDARDIVFDLSATLTKAGGSYTRNGSFTILGRTIAANSATTITRASTLVVAAPVASTNVTFTGNGNSIESTSGWLTASQSTTTSTEGFKNIQSTNVGIITWIAANTWRMTTADGPMSIGPTGSNALNLSSGGSGITYASGANPALAHAFTGTAATIAGRTFMSEVSTWTNPSAGTHTAKKITANFAENGAVASTYYVFDVDGTINISNGGSTGSLYAFRYHPTLTGTGGVVPYGIVIDASSLNNGFGTSTPTSTLHTAGSFAVGYVAKTGTYTLTATDHTVEVTSGTHTQTLPTAVGITGRIYIITNSGSGVVTVATTSSQTFANVTATPTTLTLNQFNTVIVESNGANWLRVGNL